MINKLLVLLFFTFLTACASTPDFDTTKVDRSLTPKSMAAQADIEHDKNKVILWGGTILDTRNMETLTRIEVLAYPLNASHRPLTESEPLGRFIIEHQGYLEPTSYAQGREISVIGKVSGSESGNVGESKYTYAVIRSEQIHLWSLDSRRSRTSFHFGVGVGL